MSNITNRNYLEDNILYQEVTETHQSDKIYYKRVELIGTVIPEDLDKSIENSQLALDKLITEAQELLNSKDYYQLQNTSRLLNAAQNRLNHLLKFKQEAESVD